MAETTTPAVPGANLPFKVWSAEHGCYFESFVFDLETGARKLCHPVDVKELVASGRYSTQPRNGGDAVLSLAAQGGPSLGREAMLEAELLDVGKEREADAEAYRSQIAALQQALAEARAGQALPEDAKPATEDEPKRRPGRPRSTE